MMLCPGYGNDQFPEGSLKKPVCSAVRFYNAGGSAVVELIGTMYQAGHEDYIQSVRGLVPGKAKTKSPTETVKMKHLNIKRS